MVLQSGGEASRRGGQHLRDSTPVGCLCKEQQYNDIRIVYRKTPKVPDWVWEITKVILGVILGVILRVVLVILMTEMVMRGDFL